VTATLASLARRVWTRVLGGRPEGQLLLVVDGAGWILDEVAQRLAENLSPRLDPRIISVDWARATDCTIHFIDRVWAWSDRALDHVDASNRLIGIWWHGRLDSPDASLQAALRRLHEQHHRFTRLQVTCSSGRETLEAVGVPAEKIVMLPVGVDLERFHLSSDARARAAARAALDLESGTTVIGCFQKDGTGWGDGAEPKLVKGPDLLVEALVLLHRRHRIHALIPGPARGYVRRRLHEAGVPFSAPGMVPREALPRLYHALDLYVSPSRDEGGPAGVLEAMASGVPVVSTRSGIPADLIQPGVNGQLVDVGDAGALASAAEELIGNPALGSTMAAEALVRIQPYGWPSLAARYANELYVPLQPR
jgi:glycosyltransferase involved in cell wall biosynthesis